MVFQIFYYQFLILFENAFSEKIFMTNDETAFNLRNLFHHIRSNLVRFILNDVVNAVNF